MKKGLIIFDVDGVLLDTKIGGLKYLAQFFIDKKKVAVHIREYEKRKKRGPWGLEILASFFRGAEKEKLKILSKGFCQRNLMPGARETIKSLKGRGYLIAAFSSNDIILMKELRKILKLDFIGGNKLELEEGICSGKLADKVDRYEKDRRVKKLAEKLKFKKSQVFIIGDSISDLPMAKHGIFIAFNSKDKDVKKIAEFVVNKKNLKEILGCIK